MKIISMIAGLLLGLMFVAAGAVVLLKLGPVPPVPEGTPEGHFMAAFMPTGYMTFVKVLEVAGGLCVAIPRARRLGLLILGPILVNIVAYHVFLKGGQGMAPLILPVGLTLILVWAERGAFVAFLRGTSAVKSGGVAAAPRDERL
ncbi:MAG: hypothetical protein JNL10_04230 [Verrucomicrobiales bacterium]|nr:hypothetical protein [Verrucomicrobiales bacterium]